MEDGTPGYEYVGRGIWWLLELGIALGRADVAPGGADAPIEVLQFGTCSSTESCGDRVGLELPFRLSIEETIALILIFRNSLTNKPTERGFRGYSVQ